MTIMRYQLNKIFKDVKKDFLMEGQLLDYSKITNRINSRLREVTLGKPFTKYNDVERNDTITVDDNNNLQEDLHEDITLLWKMMYSINNTIHDTNITNDIIYNKTLNKIDNIKESLTDLILLLSQETQEISNFKGYNHIFRLDFKDTKYISPRFGSDIEDMSKSVKLTSINVDTHEGIAKLDFNKTGKEIISKVKFKPEIKVQVPSVSNYTRFSPNLQDINNIIDENDISDKSNTTTEWVGDIETDEKIRTRMDLIIDVNKGSNLLITISRIEVNIVGETPMAIKILYSLNGADYYEIRNLSPIIATGFQSFDFEPTDVKYLKFIMEKDQFDETKVNNVTNSITYIYKFGFSDISWYNIQYKTRGTLYSKAISILDENNEKILLDKIAIETCTNLPEGTNIEYFIAPNRKITVGNQEVLPDLPVHITDDEWIEIFPSNDESIGRKIVSIGNILTQDAQWNTKTYDNNDKLTFNETLQNITINNNEVAVEDEILLDSIELRRGFYSFLCEIKNVSSVAKVNILSTYVKTNSGITGTVLKKIMDIKFPGWQHVYIGDMGTNQTPIFSNNESDTDDTTYNISFPKGESKFIVELTPQQDEIELIPEGIYPIIKYDWKESSTNGSPGHEDQLAQYFPSDTYNKNYGFPHPVSFADWSQAIPSLFKPSPAMDIWINTGNKRPGAKTFNNDTDNHIENSYSLWDIADSVYCYNKPMKLVSDYVLKNNISLDKERSISYSFNKSNNSITLYNDYTDGNYDYIDKNYNDLRNTEIVSPENRKGTQHQFFITYAIKPDEDDIVDSFFAKIIFYGNNSVRSITPKLKYITFKLSKKDNI